MYQNYEHHSLAYLKCVQNTYISLRLGKIIYHKAHFIIEYRMPHVTYCTCMLSHCVCVCMCVLDCSPPGFSVHGILQSRILEWVAGSSSKNPIPQYKIKSF